jgi:hypothetical protein
MFFQRIIAAVLLFTFLAQTFDQGAIELHFFANRNYIAKELCINRDKPKMQCDGKCYLSKQIQQQEKQDQQTNNSKREKFELQFFFLPANITMASYSTVTNKLYKELNSIALPDYPHAVFHPPSI